MKKRPVILIVLVLCVTMLHTRIARGESMVERTYHIPLSSVFGYPAKGMAERAKAEVSQEVEETILDFFQKCGVTYPDGSSALYSAAIQKLTVVNTEQNHQLIRQTLLQVGCIPHQVAVHAFIVSFDLADVDDVLRASNDRDLTSDEVWRLYKDGNGTLLHTLKVITRSGVNAQTQSVSERIYPTEFEVVGPTSQVENASSPARFVVNPGGFETREVGAILNVTPTMGPDASTIDLTFIFELSEELEETVFKTKCGDQVMEVSQPMFHSKHITTSVAIHNGQTISFGGLNDEENKTVTYILITATLVDADGKSIVNSPLY